VGGGGCVKAIPSTAAAVKKDIFIVMSRQEEHES